MTVIVTGGRGFVGRRLCARVEAGGDRAVALDLPQDVTDAAFVRSLVERERPRAIVHLAAVSNVPRSQQVPELTWRVNWLGACSVLGAAAATPGTRLLLVGTGLAYGPAEPGAEPFDETAPLRPRTPYAWTKTAADRLGAVFAARGVDVVRLRPFNHTGAGRPDHFAESSFARQLVEMERGRREARLDVGNLDSVRDFLHVDDVVDAYLRLLEPDAPTGLFNVASGRGTSIREILDALLEGSSVRPEVRTDPERVRPADASVGRAQRLEEATGWKPQRSLDAALGELLEDWRTRL